MSKALTTCVNQAFPLAVGRQYVSVCSLHQGNAETYLMRFLPKYKKNWKNKNSFIIHQPNIQVD
jgi:hypothetical protein